MYSNDVSDSSEESEIEEILIPIGETSEGKRKRLNTEAKRKERRNLKKGKPNKRIFIARRRNTITVFLYLF